MQPDRETSSLKSTLNNVEDFTPMISVSNRGAILKINWNSKFKIGENTNKNEVEQKQLK